MLIVLTLAFVMNASTAFVSALDVYPAGKATVEFRYNGIYGINGHFEFSNPSIIKSVSYDTNKALSGKIENDRVFLYGSDAANLIIYVRIDLKADAPVGSICDVKFNFETSNNELGQMSPKQVDVVTVKVVQKPAEPVIDYTALKAQIARADGLDRSGYTSKSWSAVDTAYSNAKKLLKSKSQSSVDAGAEALKKAIDALVPLDMSRLREAYDDAMRAADEIKATGRSWFELLDLIRQAETVLRGTDQDAADALAPRIEAEVAKLRNLEEDPPETVIVTREVEVTVPVEVTKIVEKTVEVPTDPEGPFCNIPMHRVWPILFAVTAALLILAIILLIIKLRKDTGNPVEHK